MAKENQQCPEGILRSVGYKRDFSDLDLFQTLSMPTFQSLFLETVVLSYNWNDDFKSPRPISRNLRKASRFLTPICYTRYGKNMRSYYVPQIFNLLPPSLSEITSKKKLKKALRTLSIDEEAL